MAVRTVSCPICRKSVVWEPESLYRPFCSERCKLIDLGAWVEENRGEMVQLGCFTRTRKEWEADFWNNNNEFPNNNSEKSKARLRAFKMCCTFLDLIKK